MLVAVDPLLQRDAEQRVQKWERGIVSQYETVGWFLDACLLILLTDSKAVDVVDQVLISVPDGLIDEILSRLKGQRRDDGTWRWPLGGPSFCCPPAETKRETAVPEEVSAIERLEQRLLKRMGRTE